MDGISAVKRMREVEFGSERQKSIIVAIAARAYSSNRTDSAQAGCDGFISKPVKWDTIRSTVSAVAAKMDLPEDIILE